MEEYFVTIYRELAERLKDHPDPEVRAWAAFTKLGLEMQAKPAALLSTLAEDAPEARHIPADGQQPSFEVTR